jgi:hypothetical protein
MPEKREESQLPISAAEGRDLAFLIRCQGPQQPVVQCRKPRYRSRTEEVACSPADARSPRQTELGGCRDLALTSANALGTASAGPAV